MSKLSPSRIPDWARRGIRLALALLLFTSLGLTLWVMPVGLREEWGDEFAQSCNWAGATCAVVAASPLIGKVAQLSFERTLGTITGGLLGFLVYDYGVRLLPDVWDEVFMCFAAAGVGALSCYLAYLYKLDASMRLFVITFLLVTFGAHNDKSASAVALLRTGGILLGVFIFMILTVVVLPKSSTIEVLHELRKALKLLTELNNLVWTNPAKSAGKNDADPSKTTPAPAAPGAASAVPSTSAAAAAGGALTGAVTLIIPPTEGHQQQQQQQQQQGEAAERDAALAEDELEKIRKAHETQCEKLLTDVYQSTFKVKEYAGLSDNEWYICNIGGQPFFLPFLVKQGAFRRLWKGCKKLLCLEGMRLGRKRWKLVQEDVEDMAGSIRRMARLLRMVHLDYIETINATISSQMLGSYPPELLPSALAAALTAALKALVEAFPDKDAIVVDSYKHFANLVDSMLQISNMQRRAALELLGAAARPARKTHRISHQQRSALGRQDIPAFVSYLPTAFEADGEQEHGQAGPGSPTVPSLTACSSPEVPHSARESREDLVQPLLGSPRVSSQDLDETGQHLAHSQQQQPQLLGRPIGLARNISLRGEGKGAAARALRHQMSQLSGVSNLSEVIGSPSFSLLGHNGAGGAAWAASPQTGEHQQQQEQQQQQGKGDGPQSQWGFAPAGSPVAGAKPSSPSRWQPQSSPMSLRQSMLTNSLLRPPPPPPAGKAEAAPGGEAAAAAAVGGHGADRLAKDSLDWSAEAASAGDVAGSYTAESPTVGTNRPLFPPTPEGVGAEVHWYSFQNLLDDLADELEDLYFATSDVMADLPT